MTGARLHIAPDGFDAEFGKRGELRQPVGRGGRVHMDRWLPFIVLNRSGEPSSSIARRVAINSPAYLVWSPEDDAAAEQALAAVAEAMHDRFGCILAVVIRDGDWQPTGRKSQSLPAFDVHVGASGGKGASEALDSLISALGDVEIDLRSPNVVSGELPDMPFDLESRGIGAEWLSMAIPQIHRAGENAFYPQLTHELATACGDALLRAACAFMVEKDLGAPAHFRALGRSAFLAAALDADRKLDRVARSFDFLLSLSPINTHEAMERFFADGAERAPQFRYRPLTVDPDAAKRDLYAVDLSILEDPLLEQLLAEKRQEIDHQLTMLGTRNTPAFIPASLLHYGTVGSDLLSEAKAILTRTEPAVSPGASIDAAAVADSARSLVATYQSDDPRFDAEVEVRDDVPSLLVSGGKLMIASSSSIATSRVDALLSHEISIHLLTYFNGAAQGLTVFRTGLAGYEGVQEGLGVFAEWAVGGLTTSRLRLLAARVVAVNAMLDGAEFVDTFRLLTGLGIAERSAFDVVARVFRSGGFAKDFIYLQGFHSVMEIVASGASLDPFWIGKIAPRHVVAIEELLQRGLVQPPVFRPEFLQRPAVQQRIDRVRRDKLTFRQALDVE